MAPIHDTVSSVSILLLLRAFAAGSVALTGTEAIANGVTAFKPKPSEAHNAAQTLTAMAILLAVLFVGITFVSQHLGVVPIDDPTTGKVQQTVVAQVASLVYGANSPGFYLFQIFTALILFLAANTSFNAFPRLAAILAQDGYMPRHFAFRGDRLAFTLGILLLGGDQRRRPAALPRRDDRPHPALFGGRLRQLHHQPGRHGPPLAADARTRVPQADGHQRLRLCPDRRRVGGGAGGQVARVAARGGHHPHARGADAVHPPRVPQPGAGAGGAARTS